MSEKINNHRKCSAYCMHKWNRQYQYLRCLYLISDQLTWIEKSMIYDYRRYGSVKNCNSQQSAEFNLNKLYNDLHNLVYALLKVKGHSATVVYVIVSSLL